MSDSESEELQTFTIYPNGTDTIFDLPEDCGEVLFVSVNDRYRNPKNCIDKKNRQIKLKKPVRNSTVRFGKNIQVTYRKRCE